MKRAIPFLLIGVLLVCGCGQAPAETPIPTLIPSIIPLASPLDIYTQKGGWGLGAEAGSFGLGEAVRLNAHIDTAAIPEYSQALGIDIEFELTSPGGETIFSRTERTDNQEHAIIAFMLPEDAVAGTYCAIASARYQGKIIKDSVTLEVDPMIPVCKTTKSGTIWRNETWSGTIRVTGDIWVKPGASVTILPGTTVFLAAHKDDQHRGDEVQEFYEGKRDPASTIEYSKSHISVWSKIVARGTANNRIVFTSDSLSPNYADWQQISLQPESVFEYCVIEYGRGTDIYSSYQDSEDDSITISHSIFRHMFWGAIVPHYCSPQVTRNLIYDVGHAGFEVFGKGSAPLFAHNIVVHTRCGVGWGFSDEGISPIVEHNILIDNDGSMWIGKGNTGTIGYNHVTSKGSPHDWVGYQGFTYEAKAPHGQSEELFGLGIMSSSPTVTHNTFGHIPHLINIEGNSSPTISYNIIRDGLTGIVFHHFAGGNPRISSNNIYNNGLNIILERGVIGTINAPNNWWGTTNIKEIEARIQDKKDDPFLGEVVFQPFLEESVEIGGVVSIQ